MSDPIFKDLEKNPEETTMEKNPRIISKNLINRLIITREEIRTLSGLRPLLSDLNLQF